MDFMTLIGLALGFSAVWYVLASGGILGLLYNPNAGILVFGGVLGATLITYPWRLIKKIPKCIMFMFITPRFMKTDEVIKIFENCAKKIHREGMSQSLTEDIPTGNTFFLRAINLLVDGFDEDFIKDALINEIGYFRKRHTQVGEIFKTMGTYAPIFGLLGTLIGVVQVLKNLSDPTSMGASMAIAMTTTFYGIFSTNFLFLPTAGKLAVLTEEEALVKQLIIEGVVSLKKGDIPSVVRKRLQAYLADYEKLSGTTGKK